MIADVPAPVLYGGLLQPVDLPPRTLRAIGDFEWDPGTVKVDWALSGPIPWAVTPEYHPAPCISPTR